MNEMLIVPIGGRIKAAALSFTPFISKDSIEIDEYLKEIRNNPTPDFLKCFFPSQKKRIKHLLSNIGLFRPFIKTDQGMGGNFIPFYVDQHLEQSTLLPVSICQEEGIAIPELYVSHVTQDKVRLIQKNISNFSFKTIIDELEDDTLLVRRATKGRTGFLFIRPAITENKVVFGADILLQLNAKLNELLRKIFEVAEAEHAASAPHLPFKENVLYGQVDAYILQNGEIFIEKIHLPDVGLFLNSVSDPYGEILKNVQMITERLQKTLCFNLASYLDKEIYLLTRDEVLRNHEDILEIKEIENLCIGLSTFGIKAHVISLSEIECIPNGKQVILLNLDYQASSIENLFKRYKNNELSCYPNPFVQKASHKITGLFETTIPCKYRENFLSLARSLPKNSQAERDVRERLLGILSRYGVNSDIAHVDIGSELVPVLTKSLYSWRQLPRRLDRYESTEKEIRIRTIPDRGLLLKDKYGSRLHVYRFMFTIKP
ncbi:MAG: hypothetical protein A3F18_07230 [Legionellales bacterium RIFCSPHIGHO2_12_FULL_37_14]|nr:MAG: hypothetical protein A3F18_07230 [Legionellales bacterium RIFCSPHIGHO2_12_FULL_37_14]